MDFQSTVHVGTVQLPPLRNATGKRILILPCSIKKTIKNVCGDSVSKLFCGYKMLDI